MNESTATVSTVTTNLEGVTQIKNLNPYELQQAETMASCGGVDYEDFSNVKKNGRISSLGNDASLNMQVQMKAGAWINVRKVDFGETGADRFTLRAKGTGTLEIRTIRLGASAVATIDFSSTDMEDHTIEIPVEKFKGVKNQLFFVVTAADNFYVDAWQFTEVGSAGIQDVKVEKSNLKSQTYDLTGRRLTGSNQHHGIVIEQYTDENGVKHTRKVVSGGDN